MKIFIKLALDTYDPIFEDIKTFCLKWVGSWVGYGGSIPLDQKQKMLETLKVIDRAYPHLKADPGLEVFRGVDKVNFDGLPTSYTKKLNVAKSYGDIIITKTILPEDLSLDMDKLYGYTTSEREVILLNTK